MTIHDFTSSALEEVPENDAPFGTTARSATGFSNKQKSDKELEEEKVEMERGRDSMQSLFPPPEMDSLRREVMGVVKVGVTVGIAGSAVVVVFCFLVRRLFAFTADRTGNVILEVGLAALAAASITGLVLGIRSWLTKRISTLWEEDIWEGNQNASQQVAKAHETESVAWLNALLSSIWPLVNPDLFASISDTLEDVMQASLPGIVRMVSVDDVGQGTENLRILGVRWLPTGAAARSVGSDGKLESKKKSSHGNDRKVPGEGEVDDSVEKGGDSQDGEEKEDDGAEKQVAEGMEAEEGDFVNLEVAFAYRARSSSKAFKDRTKDMHLYLAFYLPGNIKFPVWVDLRGIVGTMRLRLQLTPDPPFFALCTLTFLGQPKVDLSCIPLAKGGLNIMDLPLVSSFVQSSVDAAMAEYVAPKSLTLDLKDMLAGDDFKKDTNARGIIVVKIKRGYEFKVGDPGIPLIRDGSADPYVSVGWAKFGKPLWSTRVLEKEMEPYWNETAYLLVSSQELDVNERLRVQLWDSDRFTADDDLGRIELDLKKLMKSDETNGRLCDRTDGFRALKAGDELPGKLEWSIGYFSKLRIQKSQLEQQTYDPEIHTMDQLKEQVDQICTRKLREASVKDGFKGRDKQELDQQKAQELKTRQDAMIISAPPPAGHPSGVFSLQIHQITGLELQTLNKRTADKNFQPDEESEEGEHLPSAYCTVIINHHKVFKTRTKPKNARPFYNAGTERFIPNWEQADVFVSVRDARVKEDDPLLGIVHLPLADIFSERSQVSGFFPLTGGVGFGRVRLSMVWRSVQLQAPPRDLGWSFGTLEVKTGVTCVDGLPKDLQQSKIVVRTDIGRGKQYPSKDSNGTWATRKGGSLKLAVQKRYSSCAALQFRQHGLTGDKTAAFAVLWLHEIPDDEETGLTLSVWKGDFVRAVKCSMDTYGEKVGEIKLTLAFWSGLGQAHSKWASKSAEMKDVVEVLDCARDNQEDQRSAAKAGVVDEEVSSSSDEGSGSDTDSDDGRTSRKGDDDAALDGGAKGGGESEKKGKHTIIDSVKDLKKSAKSDKRRHRGLMQWRVCCGRI